MHAGSGPSRCAESPISLPVIFEVNRFIHARNSSLFTCDTGILLAILAEDCVIVLFGFKSEYLRFGKSSGEPYRRSADVRATIDNQRRLSGPEYPLIFIGNISGACQSRQIVIPIDEYLLNYALISLALASIQKWGGLLAAKIQHYLRKIHCHPLSAGKRARLLFLFG